MIVDLVLEAPDPTPSDGPGLWFAVVRCENCGLAYTNPRPSPATIGRFYPADYRPHRRPRKMQESRPARPLWSYLFGRPCNERRGTLPKDLPRDIPPAPPPPRVVVEPPPTKAAPAPTATPPNKPKDVDFGI